MTTKDTSEYSATQAPENRPHVESKSRPNEAAQTPGGAHGPAAQIGMPALDRDSVPSAAAKLDDDRADGDEKS